MLPIKLYKKPFDFQKEGNYSNWRWGLTYGFQNAILSFHYKQASGGEITTFETRKVTIRGKDVTIIETIDLISYKPTLINNRYELQFTVLPTLLDAGLYYFYFTDDFIEFKSELFCIKDGAIFQIIGDFSTDFSTDFK